MATDALTNVLWYIRHFAGERGDEPSDGQLLQQFVAKRDEGAFAQILHRHGPLVLGVCRQVLRNPHDAEDAFQATFLVLARKGTSIRKQESLAGWLHRVALNIARTAKTSTAQRRVQERQAVIMSQASPVDETLCDWRPLIHEEVDRLPEKYRVGVVLCYLEGKTHEEAARQVGLAVGDGERPAGASARPLAQAFGPSWSSPLGGWVRRGFDSKGGGRGRAGDPARPHAPGRRVLCRRRINSHGRRVG